MESYRWLTSACQLVEDDEESELDDEESEAEDEEPGLDPHMIKLNLNLKTQWWSGWIGTEDDEESELGDEDQVDDEEPEQDPDDEELELEEPDDDELELENLMMKNKNLRTWWGRICKRESGSASRLTMIH